MAILANINEPVVKVRNFVRKEHKNQGEDIG